MREVPCQGKYILIISWFYLIRYTANNPAHKHSRNQPLLSILIICIYDVWTLTQQLMEIVDCELLDNIVSWAPDGLSFTIHKPTMLEEKVLPLFFDTTSQHNTKYKSFLRKVSSISSIVALNDDWLILFACLPVCLSADAFFLCDSFSTFFTHWLSTQF